MAWEVSKTNLNKQTSKSGKSSPNLASGRNSPNVSGKISPRIFQSKHKPGSCPTSPLPNIDQPILEGKPLETVVVSTNTNEVKEISQTTEDLNKSAIENCQKDLVQFEEKPNQVVSDIKLSSDDRVVKSTETKSTEVLNSNRMPRKTEFRRKTEIHKNIETKPKIIQKANSKLPQKNEKVSPTKTNALNTESKVNDKMGKAPLIDNKNMPFEENRPNKFSNNGEVDEKKQNLELNLEKVNNENIPVNTVSKNIDSPSEDQRTYDILRKVGVQSAEKSTSTADDFPKLSLKKPTVVKINQECQTEDEKKALVNKPKVDVKTSKTMVTRQAYSTALTKNAVTKPASVKPKVEIRSNSSRSTTTSTKQLNKSTFSRNSTVNKSFVENNSLARSKTVSDMKSPLTNHTNRSKIQPKVDSKLPPTISNSRTVLLKKSRTTLTKDSLTKSLSLDASSVETLVNQERLSVSANVTNSSNSVASSSETINNENVNQEQADGWFTVKCKNRFKNSSKPRRSDTALSWATRFHQVSATASLPALALLPENAETTKANKSIEKSVKENINTLKSLKLDSNMNKTELRRSNTTISRTTTGRNPMVEKNKTNLQIKKTAEREKFEHQRSKNFDADSETDDDMKIKDMQDEIASEEEHRQKAKQLSDEEDRLTKEIEHLERLEIEVDTETDGTETDGDELQCDTEDDDKNGEVCKIDAVSLEARYEPMLAG